MTSIKNVILIGAGGNVGPSILNALDNDPNFTVSILARQTSKAVIPSHITTYRVEDSYPHDQVLKAFQGQDAVVCALSLANIIAQIGLIDIAVEAGVKWFIPAEYGGNKEAIKHGEKIPGHETKTLIHQHLINMEKHGLSWTAIATGPFIDWGIANGFLGFDLQNRKAKIYGTGDERWTGTKVSTIGVAVAQLLKRPEQVKNRFIYIYSVRTTQNEILAALEATTGAKWQTQHVEWRDEIAAGRELLARGNRLGVVPLILSYFYREDMGADYVKDVDADNELLELPTEDIVDVIRSIV